MFMYYNVYQWLRIEPFIIFGEYIFTVHMFTVNSCADGYPESNVLLISQQYVYEGAGDAASVGARCQKVSRDYTIVLQ